MSVRSFLVRLGTKAAAVAVFAWTGAAASAADVAPPPPPLGTVAAAPVSVGAPGYEGCESCQHGAVRSKCDACGKLLGSHLLKSKKAPYPVTLCPGACFGYFQTQWRKWDDVCPYPYTGIGVSDAPRPPAGVLNPRPGTGLESPRTLDPKMPDPKKVGNVDLPSIPSVSNKFAP